MKSHKTSTAQPEGASHSIGLLGREFYLLRFYWRGGNFWISFCEVVNHDTMDTWALLQGGWSSIDGFEVSWLS